jgi:hypothetical protein
LRTDRADESLSRLGLFTQKKAEVSKVDYSSKSKSSNVRGVGTMIDTLLKIDTSVFFGGVKGALVYSPNGTLIFR